MHPVNPKAVVFLSFVLAFFLLGLNLTLRSGVVSLSSGTGQRRLLGNLSHTLVLVAVCVAAMAVVQRVVGFPLNLW